LDWQFLAVQALVLAVISVDNEIILLALNLPNENTYAKYFHPRL
jgi:hypothetical protein